jgi:hypothetical protein
MDQTPLSIRAEAGKEISEIVAGHCGTESKVGRGFTEPKPWRFLAAQIIILLRQVKVVVGFASAFERFGDGEQESPERIGTR